MGAMGKYDITNDEQLRILTERLNEIAAERAVIEDRMDEMAREGRDVVSEWQDWRKGIEQRLGEHTALIAERLRHPLMDPRTVEEMRRTQEEIGAHLTVQDNAIAALRGEITERLAPFRRITETLEKTTRMLRWVLLAFGGGSCYEIGKVIVDRWLR
jgi:hypothetical protein